MIARSRTQVVLFVATLLYLFFALVMNNGLYLQGGARGVEDLQGVSVFSATGALALLGPFVAALGVVLASFGAALRVDWVSRRPFVSFIAIAVLAAPATYMFQRHFPDFLAERLVASNPQHAQRALDAYYAQRFLSLGDMHRIDGLPEASQQAGSEAFLFRTNLFFLLDDPLRHLSPRLSPDRALETYLYRLRCIALEFDKVYGADLCSNVSHRHASAYVTEKLIEPFRQDLKTFAGSEYDLLRIKQVVFIPYSLLSNSILLGLNLLMAIIIAIQLIAGRSLGPAVRYGLAAALLVVTFTFDDPLTSSPGYLRIVEQADPEAFFAPPALRSWAVGYESAFMRMNKYILHWAGI